MTTDESKKQLLELGFPTHLIEEALALGFSKDDAVNYILQAIDQSNWQDVEQPKAKEVDPPKPVKRQQEYAKLVIVFRDDLKLAAGAIAVCAGDAVLASFCASESKAASCPITKSAIDSWFRQGQKKVVLKVNSAVQLQELELKLSGANLVGQTIQKDGVRQALAIGPFWQKVIDSVTGKLRLL